MKRPATYRIMIPHHRPQVLVLWVIWAAILGGIVVLQLTLGGGVPAGSLDEEIPLDFPVLFSIGQVIVASMIRWIFLPRAKDVRQVLVYLIIGLSLCEAAEIFGLFLVPADQQNTKLLLWILSLVGALQFIPTYAQAKPAANRFHEA